MLFLLNGHTYLTPLFPIPYSGYGQPLNYDLYYRSEYYPYTTREERLATLPFAVVFVALFSSPSASSRSMAVEATWKRIKRNKAIRLSQKSKICLPVICDGNAYRVLAIAPNECSEAHMKRTLRRDEATIN